MERVALDGKVGGFLRIYQIILFELSYIPSKILVETALGKMSLFVLGERYPALEEDDAKRLNYTRGIKYHLPKGVFTLDRDFLIENTQAIAIQGLDLLNLFWIDFT